MQRMKNFLKSMLNSFRTVPAAMVAMSAVATVLMNILANKGLFSSGYLSLDAGFTISFIMFLVMDIVTQKYGGKASLAVTIFDVMVALVFAAILFGVSKIPETSFCGWGCSESEAEWLNNVIGNSWSVIAVSLLAFLVSTGADVLINVGIGKAFKKNAFFADSISRRSVKGFFIYFSRAYGSTFISQLVDNLVFQFIAYNFIFDWFDGTQLSIFMGALVGAVAELLMELIFAPIGYFAVSKKSSEYNQVITEEV